MRTKTIRTITPPLMPWVIYIKSGVLLANSDVHIEGGVLKPAQIAFSTAKDSSCPLYVLLLITIAG
jgi:hypothetical protein